MYEGKDWIKGSAAWYANKPQFAPPPPHPNPMGLPVDHPYTTTHFLPTLPTCSTPKCPCWAAGARNNMHHASVLKYTLPIGTDHRRAYRGRYNK